MMRMKGIGERILKFVVSELKKMSTTAGRDDEDERERRTNTSVTKIVDRCEKGEREGLIPMTLHFVK